jgi:branched-chain amino acid transport system permease protein
VTAILGRLAAQEPTAARVTRSRRSERWTVLMAALAIAVFGIVPYGTDPATTAVLINFLILVTMASMWNLLAGYAGLVSVGQQAYIGLGAYTTLLLAQSGLSPFVAIPFAALVSAVVALPVSWLVFRLRGGYFAIATWVVAVVFELVFSRVARLGGGTGAALPGLFDIDPAWITAFTYWAALVVTVASIAAIYLLLRSRIGLALTAIRDNEVGARSLGVRITLMKRVVYAVSAAGTGAAGALVAISQLNVQAASVFSVQWSAYMLFVVIIGGMGSIEGPILGAAIFFALQQSLSGYGAWYLILVGLIAMAVALRAPHGLWGAFSQRVHFSFFNVGYWLQSSLARTPARHGQTGTREDAAPQAEAG